MRKSDQKNWRQIKEKESRLSVEQSFRKVKYLENVPGEFPLGSDVVGQWGLLEVQLLRGN